MLSLAKRVGSQAAIARALGVSPSTLYNYLQKNAALRDKIKQATSKKINLEAKPGTLVDEKEILRDQVKERDKALTAVRRTEVFETRIVQALESAVEAREPRYSPLVIPTSQNQTYKHEFVLLWSDTHAGEIVSLEETNGLNEYNWEIMMRRMDHIRRGVFSYQDHRPYPVEKLHVFGLGDMLCFPAGTPIRLYDGTEVPIEEVAEGDYVDSLHGPREVAETYERPWSDDVLRTVRTIKGRGITGTVQHVVAVVPREKVEVGMNLGGSGKPFVVRDKSGVNEHHVEWRQLGEVRVGDYLVSAPHRPHGYENSVSISAITGLSLDEDELLGTLTRTEVRGNKPSVISSDEIVADEKLLRLVGLYLAEGHAQRGCSGHVNQIVWTFGDHEDDLVRETLDLVEDLFGVRGSIVRGRSTLRAVVSNQIVATLLDRLCGSGSYGKAIHPDLYRANASLLPLVGGWLDGDGCYSPRRYDIVGKTVSGSLAAQVEGICRAEGLLVGRTMEDETNLLRFGGVDAAAVANHTRRFAGAEFRPTYEDGIKLGAGWYAHRVTDVKDDDGRNEGMMLYDLTVDGNPHYQASGYLVHNSGNIHDELEATNEMPLAQATVQLGLDTAAWLEEFVPRFKEINFAGIVGNHPRAHKKPRAKQAFDNADWTMYHTARLALRKHDSVSFQIPNAAAWPVVVAENWRCLLFHGDGIRSTMPGVPWGGVMRRVSALQDQYTSGGLPIDVFMLGHFHTANVVEGSAGRVAMNGSVKGVDEYSLRQFGSGRAPQQLLLTFHPKNGLTDVSFIDLVGNPER